MIQYKRGDSVIAFLKAKQTKIQKELYKQRTQELIDEFVYICEKYIADNIDELERN